MRESSEEIEVVAELLGERRRPVVRLRVSAGRIVVTGGKRPVRMKRVGLLGNLLAPVHNWWVVVVRGEGWLWCGGRAVSVKSADSLQLNVLHPLELRLVVRPISAEVSVGRVRELWGA
jgi:hypothetical protein